MMALLDLGADVNHVMRTGEFGSALVAACFQYNRRNTQWLIDLDADVNMKLVCGKYGSALVAVCAEGKFEEVQTLIRAGASVNMQTTLGRYGNALAAACHKGRGVIVEFLVGQGADLNIVMEHGEFPTSLAAAIRGGKNEIVQVLLDNGADPNLSFPTGDFGNAVSMAIFFEDKMSIDKLISAGAHIGPLAADWIHTRNLLSTYNDTHTDKHASSSLRCIPSLTVFYCELPKLAEESQDLLSWLSDMRVLIRKAKTIEYGSVDQFLCEAYGLEARQFLRNLVRALESKERFYGEIM